MPKLNLVVSMDIYDDSDEAAEDSETLADQVWSVLRDYFPAEIKVEVMEDVTNINCGYTFNGVDNA